MAEREIHIASPTSWVRNRLTKKLEDRIDRLRVGVTDTAVPQTEYFNVVGRIRELKNVRDHLLKEVFEELADDDFEDDDEETEV